MLYGSSWCQYWNSNHRTVDCLGYLHTTHLLLLLLGLYYLFQSKKLDAIGEIIAGLGILFMGMEMMSTAMAPLRESAGNFANIVKTSKIH